MKIFLVIINLFIFTFNGYSQLEPDSELEITTITHRSTTNFFKRGEKISYTYQGERYQLDYWGKHFYSIVGVNSMAAKEMNKYRTKRIVSSTLGLSSLTFLVLTIFNSSNGFNYPYAGAFAGSFIAGTIVGNSANNNIINAANLYREGKTTSYEIFKQNNLNIKLTYKF